MADLEAIWDRARKELVFSTGEERREEFLWESAARIARTAQIIATLPEVAHFEVDAPALLAAALFHDAAWIGLVRDGEASAFEIGHGRRHEDHRRKSAERMDAALAGVLDTSSRERAFEAILALDRRQIPLIESQIVMEARNFNEVGVLTLLPIIRRGALEGKGVRAIIDTWQRQKEYHFWASFVQELRFKTVRELAQSRLDRFDRFMQGLALEDTGKDLIARHENKLPSTEPD
jgi:hypothetical protein